MLIEKKVKKKKQNKFITTFFKFYFFSTLTLLIFILLFFFNTGYWNQYKEPFLNRFYKSSVNYYLNIFEIGFRAVQGKFYTLPELKLNISLKI